MSLFTRLADNRTKMSLASRMRARRLDLFTDLLKSVPTPVTILDIGGTSFFWREITASLQGVEVVVLNVAEDTLSIPHVRAVRGDARDLSAFQDRSVDVVYSNSVIEHVGTLQDQAKMASEVRRVAKRYFVQTPNHWFPIEPHFVFPGFQYLPVPLRAFLLTKTRLGWCEREPVWQRAVDTVSSIRLLKKAEVCNLFPGSRLHEERFLGLTKSFIAYRGW